jgi:hypothetical protein
LAAFVLLLLLSMFLVALIAWSLRFSLEFSAIPENLGFHRQRATARHWVWAQPATSNDDVESWRVLRFGFPVPFLAICEGKSIEAKYVSFDLYRFVFDWFLTLGMLFAVAVGIWGKAEDDLDVEMEQHG